MADAKVEKPGTQVPATNQLQPSSPAPALELHVAARTDVGRARPHNEDYVDYHIPQDGRQLTRKGSIFLVADGMGGHRAGEVASRGAVRAVIPRYYAESGNDVAASLVSAFRSASQQLHHQAQVDPSKAGMGTTLVAAVVLGHKLYVANVGDSRAYLLNRHGMTQITEDHSWVEEQVRAGLLTEEQARRHPQRNLVTRALGSKPSVEVDIFESEIRAGDSLLLCSDGLTNLVSDAEISAIAQQYAPEEAARLLVAKANERGGNDNITVLIVSVQREPTTIKMLAIPASGEKAGRRLPIGLLLAGLAILLLVAMGGFYAWGQLAGGPKETPVPPITPSTETGTDTPRPTGTATTQEPPAATSTSVVGPTPAPSNAQGTITPLPTRQVPTLLATQQGLPPTTAATPELPAAPVTLGHPEVGANLAGVITFTWTHNGSLKPAEGFQLLVWAAGQEGSFLYVGDPLQEESYQLDLNSVLSQLGEFMWSVRIVTADSGEPLTDKAPPRSFIYRSTGGQQP
jgi:serine/threonine protein phosphatase PrpC